MFKMVEAGVVGARSRYPWEQCPSWLAWRRRRGKRPAERGDVDRYKTGVCSDGLGVGMYLYF
ncbi:MAG: hypothetical protein ACK4SY_10465 [Pyrobaculum sp.]